MKYFGYIAETESGETYVGITNNLQRRLREHRYAGPLKGTSFCIISSEVFGDRESAGLWEVATIASLGGPSKTLNTSFGGFGGRRRVVTEAERAHLSRLASDRQKPEEFRKRMSEACKSAWANPELRAAMSVRAKASCADPETKKRRSEAQKKLWEDPKVRARRIAGIKKNRNDPGKAELRRKAALKAWEARRK